MTEKEQKHLYSKIEQEIIKWNIDGTKTAGELTRNIMSIISNANIDKKSIKLKKNLKNCKCIRYTGGDKWYPNGCDIHPNG